MERSPSSEGFVHCHLQSRRRRVCMAWLTQILSQTLNLEIRAVSDCGINCFSSFFRGIGCDSQSMPNEWCRNLLSTITCGIGELFITLSGAGNVSILQHLSHFINRSSTKRIVLDTWRHSSEILPWITSPDFYLSDAAQTAKSLRVQFVSFGFC